MIFASIFLLIVTHFSSLLTDRADAMDFSSFLCEPSSTSVADPLPGQIVQCSSISISTRCMSVCPILLLFYTTGGSMMFFIDILVYYSFGVEVRHPTSRERSWPKTNDNHSNNSLDKFSILLRIVPSACCGLVDKNLIYLRCYGSICANLSSCK